MQQNRMKAALVVLAAAGLLTACGSGSGGSPAAPAGSSAETVAPGPSSGASSSSSSVGRCATSDLRVSLGRSGAAAGTTYRDIDFQNVGSRPCTLTGYPGVSFTDRSGRQVGHAASRNPTTPARQVTLAAGAFGHATVGVPDYANFPRDRCHPATAVKLRVYPPNLREPVLLGDRTTLCTTAAGRPAVTPVRSGR